MRSIRPLNDQVWVRIPRRVAALNDGLEGGHGVHPYDVDYRMTKNGNGQSAEPLQARGQRLPWDALPMHIVQTIDLALGDPIVEATTLHGGFSPGIACIGRTFGGQQFFIKAACSLPNEHAPNLHRNEIRIASRFGPDVPAPRLIWSFDEGAPGWVVLVFEVVDGQNPVLPWREHDVDLVVNTLNQLAISLTPSPVGPEIIGEVAVSALADAACWQLLATDPPDSLDDWSLRHLDRLVELSAQVGEVIGGNSLVHLDIRGDNLLITETGVVVVDWPHAKVGAAWVDALCFAPSLAMQGGPDPEALIARIDACRNADPMAITITIAALAGFFTYNASLPPLEGLPGLREFQDAQAVVARRWLAQRTGWT